MSRDKQVEELTTELIKTNSYGTLNAVAEHLYNAGYRKQEWISVEERLPEQPDTYIACRNDGYVGFAFFTGASFPSVVTHWMPLPEAPKMKGGAE